jgi:hypothetical protein
VVKECRGVSTLALAAEQNGRGLLTQPPPVRARDVLYNSSSSRNAGRIHLWRGCTYYPRVRRGLSFRIITRTRAAPGHTVRATVATRPNERARPRRGGDPINLRKRKKALLTNARRPPPPKRAATMPSRPLHASRPRLLLSSRAPIASVSAQDRVTVRPAPGSEVLGFSPSSFGWASAELGARPSERNGARRKEGRSASVAAVGRSVRVRGGGPARNSRRFGAFLPS